MTRRIYGKHRLTIVCDGCGRESVAEWDGKERTADNKAALPKGWRQATTEDSVVNVDVQGPTAAPPITTLEYCPDCTERTRE